MLLQERQDSAFFEDVLLAVGDRFILVKRVDDVWAEEDDNISFTFGAIVFAKGSADNGPFECRCYHPLFCFNPFGDVEGSLLREGHVHSAKDWPAVLEPVVAR